MTQRTTTEPQDHPPGSSTFTTEQICRLQLDAAIDTYARTWNVPATHLLASAAHGLMRDHARKRRVTLRADIIAVFEAVLPYKEAQAAIKAFLRPYNSFKHRNGETVTLHHLFVELSLYHACAEFGAFYGHLGARMAAFNGWILAAHERVSDRHEEALRIFPSAKSGEDRLAQMKELRKVLNGIDQRPGAHPDIAVDMSKVAPPFGLAM